MVLLQKTELGKYIEKKAAFSPLFNGNGIATPHVLRAMASDMITLSVPYLTGMVLLHKLILSHPFTLLYLSVPYLTGMVLLRHIGMNWF